MAVLLSIFPSFKDTSYWNHVASLANWVPGLYTEVLIFKVWWGSWHLLKLSGDFSHQGH